MLFINVVYKLKLKLNIE